MLTAVRRLALLFVAGLVLGAGFAVSSAVASHQFSDVPNSNNYHGDIDWLVDHGIAGGFPNGTFKPADPITRAQASRWLRKLNRGFEIVVNSGTIVSANSGTASATCPAGKRALSVTGQTDAFNLFMTDTSLSSTTGVVRWESDNNADVNATTQVRLLCGFTT